MRRVLPSNPSLEHLKKQAKDFLKEYQAGDSHVYSRIQTGLPRFKNKPVNVILEAGITLHDAQHIVAQEYGFGSWTSLRSVVEAEPNSLAFPGQIEDPVLSHEEIRRFCDRGYIWLREAFPREKALHIQDFM